MKDRQRTYIINFSSLLCAFSRSLLLIKLRHKTNFVSQFFAVRGVFMVQNWQRSVAVSSISPDTWFYYIFEQPEKCHVPTKDEAFNTVVVSLCFFRGFWLCQARIFSKTKTSWGVFKCYTPLMGHVIPDVDVGAKRLLTIGYYYGNIIFIQKFRDRRSNYLKVAITIKLYWTINFSLSIGNAEN